MDDVHAHLGVLDLLELAEERLDRALDVALEDDVQVLHLAGLEVVVQRLERDAPPRALRELLAAEPLCAHVRQMLRLALVLDDADELAGGGRMVEPEHLDGLARPRVLHLLAAVVVQRAHLAGRVACDRGVADPQRPAVHEHRRDRPAADVEPRLDDDARRVGAGVGAQVELGVRDEEDLLEQVVEVLLLLRRDRPRTASCRPSPRAGGPRRRARSSPGRRSRPGMSILFTATTIGTSAARAWEIDSFVCGMTPSSAATTRTAMSVTFAPRARMAVNASWPGVSRNVMRLPSTSAWYAPMCCVIPPASVSTTDASRIASRSVVFPWSTWPMIVTTGGRGGEVGLVVVVRRRLELLLGRVLDRDLALELACR